MTTGLHGSRQGALAALPAPLERTLARLGAVAPRETRDAAAALREALGPMGCSTWPEVAWRSSTLTGPGFPVELAWASRDTAVRWTCEVAGPEVPAADRLARCGLVAADLAGAPLDVEAWMPTQRGRTLRYGAWLGLRHRDGERRAKVYVELPSEPVLPRPWADTADLVARAVPGLVWRMAGSNDDGSVELYARVAAPGPTLLAAVAGLVEDAGSMESLVAAVLGPRPPVHAGRIVLPRPSGVSVVLGADGAPQAVTWFAFGKALWSSDAIAAAAVTRLCDRGLVRAAPGSTALYAALAKGPDDGRWRLGMLGVGVDRAGTTWLQAGVRPT